VNGETQTPRTMLPVVTLKCYANGVYRLEHPRGMSPFQAIQYALVKLGECVETIHSHAKGSDLGAIPSDPE
jgi:hypothetical protein